MTKNRPIDTALLAIAVTIGLGIIAAAIFSYYLSGQGDSISGRIAAWGEEAPPISLVLFGSAGGYVAGLICGALFSHWFWPVGSPRD